MKHIVIILLIITSVFSFAQEENKEQLLAVKKANNFVYEGNELIADEDFISAEMEYRKAISERPTTVAGAYNLGTSYFKSGNLEESLYRLQQATETATSKSEKHKAFHNIGNILMQNKKCKAAVEAYKNALRNDPSDDETRYNLGVAKICAEEEQKQEDQNKDENKEDQDKKENKDKEGDNKEDKKDEGDQEKKEGEDEKDEEGKPKDEKKDKGKGDEDKKKEQQKPQPQPGQLSHQQIKNLLEAMNNQEQKVQEKMNAEKQKGVKIKTEKDW
tara:strand:+ start:592 stop:1410 length:819 start_codon:yes stop_codon:yes gene_type:complete